MDCGSGNTPAGVTFADPGSLFGCGITPVAVADDGFNGDTTLGPFDANGPPWPADWLDHLLVSITPTEGSKLFFA